MRPGQLVGGGVTHWTGPAPGSSWTSPAVSTSTQPTRPGRDGQWRQLPREHECGPKFFFGRKKFRHLPINKKILEILEIPDYFLKKLASSY